MRDPVDRLFYQSRTRARYLGIPFSLTIEDVRAVWPKDGCCPALGIRLRYGLGKPHDASPTLDRLVANWPYEPGNIAVLSYTANRAKGRHTAADLRKIAAWMKRNGLS